MRGRWIVVGGLAAALIGGFLVLVPLLVVLSGSASTACGLGSQFGMPANGLTVASWNLWGDSGTNQGRPLAGRRADMVQQITGTDPDLMFLQEASKRGGSEFETYLTSKTKMSAAGPSEANVRLLYDPTRLTEIDSGLWRLSGTRVAVFAKLRDQRTGSTFLAISTHLQHLHGAKWNKIRTQQMNTLLRKANRYDRDLPRILGGDLNTSQKRFDGAGALNSLRRDGWLNASAVAAQKDDRLATSLAGNVGRRSLRVTYPGSKGAIDHIMVRGKEAGVYWYSVKSQSSILGKKYARLTSDHNMVAAGISLDGKVGLIPSSPGRSTLVSPSTQPASSSTSTKWSGEQRSNAQAIVAAGQRLGVSQRGQVIAVMTAMGESSLRVLNRGDVAGPDSRGLFQQRSVGWGSLADRMDPGKSATIFYRALLKVPGWEQLAPTEAAHRTQRNADPNHYAKFWKDASALYAQISGTSVGALEAATSPGCETGDLVNASWSTSGECGKSGKYNNPNNCQQALAEARRIAKEQPCRSHLSGGTWRRWCLAFVAYAYGRPAAGYATAMDMYRAMKSKGLISTSKEIPAGALVFFSSSSPAGHVALYNGGGKAWSNDYIRGGCIDLTPMSTMGRGGRYLGWAPPAFPGA